MTKPLRVLQMVTQMNRAGMESRLMDIYRNIDRQKIQFDFYTCRYEHGCFDDEIIGLGGKVFYNIPLNIQNIIKIPSRFERFFKDNPQYQIVHCHLNQWCGLILKGAKKANVPVRIAHSRTALTQNSLKNMLKNLIKLSVNHTATHKFAVSGEAGLWLYGARAAADGSVITWPNAIDCKKFIYSRQKRAEIRKNLGLDEELTIIHVGNLRPEKNHRFLLEVFREILKSLSNAKLLLIGDDFMNGAVQEQAERMGLGDQVLFLYMRSDVPDLLQAGDVFVFPSLYEGFAGAVLEAQAAGLPCLISDTITSEVCLLPTTMQYSLSAGPRKWAEQIVKLQRAERKITYAVISEAGYDIRSLTNQLTHFYLSAVCCEMSESK